MMHRTSVAARLVFFASIAVCVVWPQVGTAQPVPPRTFRADLSIAQVTAGNHFFDTVRLALELHPNTRRLYIRQTLRTSTQVITQVEALEQVLGASRVPVYVAAESLVGQGVVGGVVLKNEAMAELAVDRLPAETDIRFRAYTFWEQNQRYVVGALTVFLIQSCLIAGLLMQRSRRRRAEGALRVNEHALQVSQEDTRRLAGRLIAAQEVERARIARELHDDLSQKVALLAMDINQIALSESPGIRSKANGMTERVAEIGMDIHNLSHELHPAKLQILGLVQATQFLCRDLAGRHRLDIDFVHEHMPSNVPPDPALCLFRIAQEALQNVVKHSSARNATVKLTGSADPLRLEIFDSGAGFDTSTLGEGMGLLSMRERVNFLDGRMTIRSRTGTGTRIIVQVPVVQSTATANHARSA